MGKLKENYYMVVYKFGGASVKDTKGVENLTDILISRPECRIVVVSAFGKTTNRLEEIIDAIYHKQKKDFHHKLDKLKDYHFSIVKGLFGKKNDVHQDLELIFERIEKAFDRQWMDYDYLYDQIVPLGEIISTKVINAYLNEVGLKSRWVDIRENLITDSVFREASVQWDRSKNLIIRNCIPAENEIVVTQGFIGGDAHNQSTTLGREGSDYTAAIIANILDAEKIVIWKDVPGVMNADPRYFKDAEKLERISFQEAIELAYYGAKILHPKTIKPIQNKNIPLWVKSFLEPEKIGTLIGEYPKYEENKPIFILKKNQILISVLPKDFSFVFEETLSRIYSLFAKYRIKVNLVQNSAINFSFCADGTDQRIYQLIEELKNEYKVLYNTGLELLTIRHYMESVLQDIQKNREILLEQRTRHTAQYLMKG